MKVKRPVSGYYALDVCDLCQAVLNLSPYLPRKCHCCGRELCQGCAGWKQYADAIGSGAFWVGYCAECDTRLASGEESNVSDCRLHSLYRKMQTVKEDREAAIDAFDEQARELQGQIHAMAETFGKSLGKFSI